MVKIKNFTPLFDSITQKFGPVVASVYGRVWRYERGKAGYCYAAKKTISDDLGISERTVQRHLQLLVENKYLKRLTDEARAHKPHNYITTKKTGLNFTIEAYDEISEGKPKSLPSKNEGEPKSHGGETESPLNIQYKKEEKPVVNAPKNSDIPEPETPDPLDEALAKWVEIGGQTNGSLVQHFEGIVDDLEKRQGTLRKDHLDKNIDPYIILGKAINLCFENNAPRIAYLNGIIKNWEANGFIASIIPKPTRKRKTTSKPERDREADKRELEKEIAEAEAQQALANK